MAASSLTDVLFAHERASPHDPWLFYRRGWDWRWLSFAAAARAVAAAAAAARRARCPPRAAFAGVPELVPVLADLALLAAGLVSIPLDAGLDAEARGRVLAERRAEVWVEASGDAADPAPRVEAPAGLPSLALRLSTAPGAAPAASLDPSFAVQGAAVAVAPDGRPVELSQAALAAAGERLQAVLGAAGERDIAVCHRPLERLDARRLLAWATVAGAALLLEPDPASLVPTAVWARPTVVAGTAEELAGLRQTLAAGERRRRLGRRPPRPFGRLRALLVATREELPAEDLGFWREREVAVLPLAEAASGALGGLSPGVV